MDAKDIAEELYRSFKSQVLWKEVDFKRIRKFEKIIKKRFAIILKETIDKHIQFNTNSDGLDIISQNAIDTPVGSVLTSFIDQPKKTTKDVIDAIIDGEDNDEELIIMQPGEPMTLLQRIVNDQDNQFIQDVLKEAEEKENEVIKDKVKVFTEIANDAIKKRFKVDIVCMGIIKKPNFQIFKGQDIVETNFKTDEITSQKKVFFAYIDTDKEQNIRECIPEYFNYASVKIEQVDIDIVPIQYQQIWQNRTNL